MSKYVYQRSFFGGKLVDPKTGEELKISGSKMRARATAANGKFVMISRLGQTPALHSVDRLDSSILEGHSENGIHCKMSLATGAVSEPYTMTKSGYISTPDGKLNVLDKNLQSKVTGYGTVRDEKGVPIVKVLLTRSSNDFAVAQNAQGKFGVISPDGRAVCPFVYDSPEIALNHEFPSERGYPKTYSFVGKGKEIISNENGVVIAEKPFTAPYNEVFRDGSTVYYSSYDKKKDVSTVMSMNTYTGKVSEYASLQGKVHCGAAYSHGDVVFCTSLNGKKGLVSKDGTVVLDHKYDDIRARTIHTHYSSEPVFELVNTETTESGKTSKLGIYSLRDSKVSFEPTYKEIDYYNSERVQRDGVTKFFACDENGNWGVVNSNGKVELDFKYHKTFGTQYITGRYTTDEKGWRNTISELKILDENDEVCYFNIGEKNIIATPKEVKDIKTYEGILDAEAEEWRAEKEAKRKAETERKSSDPKYSEEEVYGAAAAASIIAGSPIAGMIVKGLMDDENERSK